MRAAWLFREVVVKHGGAHYEGDVGDVYGQEADDSKWETVSESDIGNDGRGEVDDDDDDDDESEWKNKDNRMDKYDKASIKGTKFFKYLLII